MFRFLLTIALILILAGGAGLFCTNIVFTETGQDLVYGNLTYGTFTLLALVIFTFMGIYNVQRE